MANYVASVDQDKRSLRPRTFRGLEGDNLDLFLARFEDWMSLNGQPKDRYVTNFATYLDHQAYEWFRGLDPKVKQGDWDDFVKLFRARQHAVVFSMACTIVFWYQTCSVSWKVDDILRCSQP